MSWLFILLSCLADLTSAHGKNTEVFSHPLRASLTTFNSYGELTGIDYSDATTDVVYSNHDRRGLPQQITDATGTRTVNYDHAARLTKEAWRSGTFSGLAVTNRFNPVYGRDRLRVEGLASALQQGFGYDGLGRYSTCASGVLSATYGYLPNSDLLQTTTSQNNGTNKLVTTRTWNYGTRLQSIVNTTNSAIAGSTAYLYDNVQRRTKATDAEGAYWLYGYDDRNEVNSARRYWGDQTYVAGQQFLFSYDPIGNRTNAQSGGDVNGLKFNLRRQGRLRHGV